jgi:hypothetical protein
MVFLLRDVLDDLSHVRRALTASRKPIGPNHPSTKSSHDSSAGW